jgi:hypothetical protein
MRIRNALLASALIALAAAPLVPRVLRACGPYFPLDILSDRAAGALKTPPAPSIFDGLVPKPGDRLVPVEPYGDEEQQKLLDAADREGLPAAANPQIAAMRAAATADAAFAAGEGLPEAVRAYTAGAVAFRHRQFDRAQHYFERVLALKPGEAAASVARSGPATCWGRSRVCRETMRPRPRIGRRRAD